MGIFLAALTMVTLAFRYALPVRDGDLWWHMLYGKYFLENHTLIADHTIFSWSPTTNDRIYCTWLADIFLYLMHRATGLTGLFAFRYLCLFTLIAGCFFYARRQRIATHPLTWFLCLNALLMAYTAAFLKPEIISFALMTLSAWNWWHIRSSGEKAWRSTYLFPLIMLVWVNSHGGFVFGAVFYLLIAAGELLNSWLAPKNTLPAHVRKHLAIALPLAALAVFLTPYGYHYPLQLVSVLQPSADNMNYVKKIAAYVSPFAFEDTYNLTLCADLAIALLLILFFRNFRKVEWSALLANLIFAFLYTRFFRTTFYWAPVFLFASLNLLACGPLVPDAIRYSRVVNRLLTGIILVCGCLLAGNTLYKAAIIPENYIWMGFGISEANPVEEAQYIKKYFPDARIGNTYDQGAYLLWELWPENKVFFDSRHFPYRAWSDEYFSFAAGSSIKAFTEKYPCDLWCIGLQNSTLLIGLLLSEEWKLALYGKNAAVLVRNDISLPEGVSRTSKHIYNLKNLSNALDIFKFAIHIGDFETAEKLLAAMQSGFSSSLQRKALRWTEYYLTGLKAYQVKNYGLAERKLGLISDPPDHIRFIRTNCYQYLTKRAWEQNDAVSALKFARKGLELVPDNHYSLYNAGVIGWLLEKETASASSAENKAKPPIDKGKWREPLQKFLEVAQADQDFTEFLETASAILGGRQEERPRLLIPLEPTNKKLFVEVLAK